MARTSIPRPSTTELPFAAARLATLGGGSETTGVGDGGVAEDGGCAGGEGAGGAAVSFTAPSPFFFAGFFPFPWREAMGAGSGPFVRVSFTSATNASDTKGFSIVATTFLYFRAVAAISATCADIITTGTRAVASFCNNRSQTWSPRRSGRL